MKLTNQNIVHALLILLFCYICSLFVVGLWPMNFRQHNTAALDHQNGLTVSPPSTTYSQNPPQKLFNVKEFTILIDMTSDFPASKGFGSIVLYGLDYHDMNFLVGQWRSGIELRIASDGHARTISFGKKNVFRRGEQSLFAIVYDLNKFVLYHNGEKIATRRTGPLTFSRWNRSYPLVIGSDAKGHSTWKGAIQSIAIFDRALPECEVQNTPVTIGKSSPLVCYTFTNNNGTTVRDCGAGTPATLIIPQRFVPYVRAVLELPVNEWNKYSHNLLDITINLLGFIPLGIFLSMYLTHKNVTFKKSLLVSIVVGFAISFAIEISQAFLSSRSSSMVDLLNNTLGSATGACLYYFRSTLLPKQGNRSWK
ncbi:MAG: VanZ family protein [Deltaproteobacteria bacterium]|nr:VanZ family protein [Deltaproteobacteria bacterium]